jgi:hypothetical protein
LINEKKLIKNLFLDTGSAINCIDFEFAKSIGIKMSEKSVKQTKFVIRTANDIPINCKGTITVSIKLGKCQWRDE